ncbi:MAG: membrane integrity-associated transporter subunit PqiC [Verrucomicrobiaceae bacterium]|jgi:hypothetical protein|nr:MAG: membrane integrity-associated transporter subunit PqiC [Verrucomicrobiaceae bacterium]
MKTIALFPVLLAASCGVLTPVKDVTVNHVLDATVPARQVTGSSPAIAIARPSLPGYLDRQQLVSRGGDGRILMNSYQLWAEPLDTGISRVTALNLGRLANSLNIQPVETFVTLDYESLLEIRISRFEPDAAGNVVLECTWKLQPVSGRVTSPRTFHTVIQPAGPQDAMGPQAGRIAAMNEALARLAREISRAL